MPAVQRSSSQKNRSVGWHSEASEITLFCSRHVQRHLLLL